MRSKDQRPEDKLMAEIEKIRLKEQRLWKKVQDFFETEEGLHLWNFIEGHRELCEDQYRRGEDTGTKYDFVRTLLELINKPL